MRLKSGAEQNAIPPPPPHRTETKKAEADQAEGEGFGHGRQIYGQASSSTTSKQSHQT